MKLITALATPFWDGKIHLESYKRLLATQNEADALLCVGTTGEGALLCPTERKTLIQTAKCAQPDKAIWVGISSGATIEAVKEARAAKRAGADGLLVAPPAFFKCTEEGYVRHVESIMNAAKLPVMLYNAPSRCGYAIWKSALAKLAQTGVTCVKDAGGDAAYAQSTGLEIFCGNEEKLLEFARLGAAGVVSVVSCAMPSLVKQACAYAESGTETADATNTLAIYQRLVNVLFCQTNPIPIKYLLYRLGIFATCEMRLPLTEAKGDTRRQIDSFLENLV